MSKALNNWVHIIYSVSGKKITEDMRYKDVLNFTAKKCTHSAP